MFESVDLDARLSKTEYREILTPLELRLGELQRDMRASGIPVVIAFEGWEASGVGTVIGRLLAALDPRGYKLCTFLEPSETELLYPPMWRYWKTIPARGQIVVYDGCWYVEALEKVKSARGRVHKKAIRERIRVFERQLVDDGAVMLKFWLHVDKAEQARRFKKLKKDPALAWKVTKEDWRRHAQYEKSCRVVDAVLTETSTEYAPWTIVASHNLRYATVKVAETVARAFEEALAARRNPPPEAVAIKPMRRKLPQRQPGPLDAVDLSLSLDRETYEKTVPEVEKELLRLESLIYPYRIPVVIVYEGWDASGKGGNIKRLVQSLDHRGFEVVPVGAPEGDEKTHHYLWRFWRNLPKGGHMTIFDRSWYGRVLVERVEGFAAPAEWERAYREINEFEAELTSYGAVVVKFWIHISKDEQLRRFRERERTPYKQWKITPDDWRNRKHWNAYYQAVSDMIERTSTPHAPWTIIEGNDKLHARIKALKTVSAAIIHALANVKGKPSPRS